MSGGGDSVVTSLRRGRIPDWVVWALPMLAIGVAVVAMVVVGVAWWRMDAVRPAQPAIPTVPSVAAGAPFQVGDDAIGDGGAAVRSPAVAECPLTAVWRESGRVVCIELRSDSPWPMDPSGIGPTGAGRGYVGGERGGPGGARLGSGGYDGTVGSGR